MGACVSVEEEKNAKEKSKLDASPTKAIDIYSQIFKEGSHIMTAMSASLYLALLLKGGQLKNLLVFLQAVQVTHFMEELQVKLKFYIQAIISDYWALLI